MLPTIAVNRSDKSSDDEGFSIVCGVMNRAEPLRYTIPTFLQQALVRQIVLIDWNSRVPLIESLAELDIPGWPDPRVVIIRVEDQPHWSLAKAINLGVRLVNQAVTLKIDADILILRDVDPSLTQVGECFIAGNWRLESCDQIHLSGTTMFGTEDFRNVGGYDERINSYGWEDDDLYHRLETQGIKRCNLDHRKFFHLPHSDAKRMAHQRESPLRLKAPWKSSIFNRDCTRRRAPWHRSSSESNYRILSIDENKKHIVVRQQTP